jgi:acyl-ACP thioesterase
MRSSEAASHPGRLRTWRLRHGAGSARAACQTGRIDELVPIPSDARTFSSQRTVRLADLDARGRLRLDAIARFLQDVAIEDVDETGWGMPEHLWFVRSIRLDLVAPFLDDRTVELVTWSSGLAAVAAGRRWSVTGDAGGRLEVDSVWIHLGPDGRPARIEDFEPYAEASRGRLVSTRLTLAEPGEPDAVVPWPLRVTDVDRHGHVNNAVHWQAVEHVLADGGPDPRSPLRARLDYREALDLGERVELAVVHDGPRLTLALRAEGRTKAVATVEPLGR